MSEIKKYILLADDKWLIQSSATSPREYINALPDNRKNIITALRKAILKNLPKGFKEE